MDFQRGDVIEYESEGRYHLGAVSDVGKSLRVIDDTGRDFLVSTRSVTFRIDAGLKGLSDAESVSEDLMDIKQQLEELLDMAELPAVWELLGGEEMALDLDGMTDLLFGETDDISRLAVHRLLRDDRVYFKEKRGEYRPRSKEQVEQLQIQLKREREAQRARQNFIDTVCEIATSDDSKQERQAAIEEATGDPDFRQFFESIEQFAIYGDDYTQRSDAEELLSDIERAEGYDLQLKGRGPVKAFNLMVALKWFEPHENVWLHRLNIDTQFSDELLELAEEQVASLPFVEATDIGEFDAGEEREDLTDLPIITIDDASTLDIDDGLSARRLADEGLWELGIHIADPGASVPLGHPLDEEARRRGTSIYDPVYTIPMFPRILSEEVMSLVEGKIRPAISFISRINDDFEIVDIEIIPSWVKVRQRMTYEEADDVLQYREEHELVDMLQNLQRLSEGLMNKRLDHGAVVLQLPETKVRIEGRREDGRLTEVESVDVAVMDETSASRELVQEMMIQTGHLVGRYCRDENIPVIYRSQPAPTDPEREEILSGEIHGLVEAWEMRRWMQRSSQGTTPAPHFGLGLEVYVQATSPIRRYNDLVCHHQLRAHLRGDPLPFDVEEILKVAGQVQALSADSRLIERESKRYWILTYLAERKGETMTGTVIEHISERRNRVAVMLDDIGFVTKLSLTKQVELGSRVRLRLKRIEPRRDLLVTKMVEEVEE